MTYVDITREDFEEWLNSTKFRGKWSVKPRTVGIFVLPLSERVAIELSSSLTGTSNTMGYANASMSMKLVSLITGRTLNKVAQGQSHWKRTKGWRASLEQGLGRMEDAYRKSEGFYEALAEIENQDQYRADLLGKIENVQGWAGNQFISDMHERLKNNSILTIKQRDALLRALNRMPTAAPAPKTTTPPEAPEGFLEALRDLYREARRAGNNNDMQFIEMIGKQVKGGRPLSRWQEDAVDRLFRQYHRGSIRERVAARFLATLR